MTMAASSIFVAGRAWIWGGVAGSGGGGCGAAAIVPAGREHAAWSGGRRGSGCGSSNAIELERRCVSTGMERRYQDAHARVAMDNRRIECDG
jgi:hypothetical protein